MGINNDEINHGVFHGSNQKFALLTEESTVIQWRETVYITVYCRKLVCTRFPFSALRGLVLPMFA